MTPRSRTSILVLAAVALTVPYVAFVVYFSTRFPPNQWPTWFTDVLAAWFVANFIVIVLIARGLSKRQQQSSGLESVPPRKAGVRVWILRIVGSYLVLVWSVLFFVGVKGTIRGEYPLNRAIPAGAFLLFFISMFGWGVYRSFRPKT
jgi:hypothetical protein